MIPHIRPIYPIRLIRPILRIHGIKTIHPAIITATARRTALKNKQEYNNDQSFHLDTPTPSLAKNPRTFKIDEIASSGFSRQNLQQMRQFYLLYPPERICQTPSGELEQIPNAENSLAETARCLPLPWSAYVRLCTVKNENARRFYETEALRGGWSVRQLNRQINSQFFERTALSRDKAAMLSKSSKAADLDATPPEEEIKDPYFLEFLDLKDEYSESDLEEALIRHLEVFLLELGGDFCFIGRQKRLRIGDEWYRVDLIFFHRRLRCLVVIDLKTGKFSHADAGQMHLYLNYAREHWTREGENPPVGLILCAYKNDAVARYALEGLPNKVMAAEYRTALPDEKKLAAEIKRTRTLLQNRKAKKEPSGKTPDPGDNSSYTLD
jgi:predicted nuclease of restriction endonuclease-like (RecB) superfamily